MTLKWKVHRGHKCHSPLYHGPCLSIRFYQGKRYINLSPSSIPRLPFHIRCQLETKYSFILLVLLVTAGSLDQQHQPLFFLFLFNHWSDLGGSCPIFVTLGELPWEGCSCINVLSVIQLEIKNIVINVS